VIILVSMIIIIPDFPRNILLHHALMLNHLYIIESVVNIIINNESYDLGFVLQSVIHQFAISFIIVDAQTCP